MAKYIDSDFFRGVLNRMVEHLEAVDATRDAETIKSVIRFLKVMEEFHAVEVVRCKDCKNRDEITKECKHPKAVSMEKGEPMTIAKAITMLIDEHDKAKKNDWVRNPVAYALYQVWKKADGEKR